VCIELEACAWEDLCYSQRKGNENPGEFNAVSLLKEKRTVRMIERGISEIQRILFRNLSGLVPKKVSGDG
jgi:hypothetical protein